jgi:mevalonate kinase
LKARIPGKIMLCGEYAVLQGATSLAATVDSWLTVSIEDDPQRLVSSDLWPHRIQLDKADSDHVQREPLLQSSLLAAPKDHGFHVHVASDLAVEHGLGSSSALRLGVHLGFRAWQKQPLPLSEAEAWSAAEQAWQEQLQQQSFASGYDTVVQLTGGLVRWTPSAHWPGTIQKYDAECLSRWVHPYVGGQGAPTAKVGGSMRQWLTRTGTWDQLRSASEDLREEMEAVFLHGKLSTQDLFQANARHRSFFQNGPGFPSALYNLLASLPGFDRSWTFKTTGAGGEDAILLIGEDCELMGVKKALSYHGWYPLGLGWQNRGAWIQ